MCDIIFNETVPDHLSATCPLAPTTTALLPSSPRPICSHIQTAGGQAYADIIHAKDEALATWHLKSSALTTSGGEPMLLFTILDFVSLLSIDSYLESHPLFSLTSFSIPSFTSFDFIFCSFLSVSPDQYLKAPVNYSDNDLLKPPKSYFEACSWPDASTWHSVMGREIDSL